MKKENFILLFFLISLHVRTVDIGITEPDLLMILLKLAINKAIALFLHNEILNIQKMEILLLISQSITQK